MSGDARSVAAKILWTTKTVLARLPGLYPAYRWFTKRRGEGKVYRIRFGPMKGLRWRRWNSLPYWYHLGLYEPHVSELIARSLRPGAVFWDVGANAGYHTLMAARVVGPGGRVVAVEADPKTIQVLGEQLALNEVSNCEVVHAAVGDRDGTVEFSRKPNSLQSTLARVDEDGEHFEVPGARLDTLACRFARPNVIKIDIEGAEVLALPGGRGLLTEEPRPTLLLSVHGQEAASFCRAFLKEHGYRFQEQSGFEQMWVAVPGARE